MLVPRFSPRQWRWIVFALLALAAALLWLLFRFISPAPPSRITITAGPADGAYAQFAGRYKEFLANNGIKLDVQTSTGSVQNLERLQAGSADVGLVQSGLGFLTTDPQRDSEESPLLSLATLTYEPVWIFSRQALNNGLTQLVGKKIAVGVQGSGTRKVALDLLRDYGVTESSASLLAVGGIDAAQKLIGQEIDAAIFISAPQGAAVAQLLRTPGVQLASLVHSDGLARRFPYLQAVTLKQGSIDPKSNLPPADVTLLSTTANLVIGANLHPALAYLLLEAAVHVHHTPSLFGRAEDFPSPKGVDFPLAEEADRYFKEGRPFLQRYLPFWLANFLQRLILVAVPLLAIALPIFKTIPELFDFKDKNRLYYRYADLLEMETDLRQRQLSAEEIAQAHNKLNAIEENIRTANFPLDFADRVFTLRQHVDYVRQRLEQELVELAQSQSKRA
jgi:TRAP transporter TAXI family solute receptor